MVGLEKILSALWSKQFVAMAPISGIDKSWNAAKDVIDVSLKVTALDVCKWLFSKSKT